MMKGAPTGLRPPAQRCRFGYVGEQGENILNRNAVASLMGNSQGRRNRVAVEELHRIFPRVADRVGNPGLQDAAPLGQRERNDPEALHKLDTEEELNQ